MIRIALLDGSLEPGFEGRVSPATQHARAVAAAIRSFCPEADIIECPVFTGHLTTTRAQVVQAVTEALATDAVLLHCSFGFPEADAATAAVFRLACRQFRFVVASSPARGQLVYPAAYPNVIKASGDARCGPHDYSWLGTEQVDFAASALPLETGGIGGSSVAAGRVSGVIARACLTGMETRLVEMAGFHGPERRG